MSLEKIQQFVTSDGKFPEKRVRNAGFAGKHCKIHFDDEDGSARMRYWDTDVATLNKDGTIVLDMGGFRTRSTKDAINIFFRISDAKDLSMRRKNWEYILERHSDSEKSDLVASFGHQMDCDNTPVVIIPSARASAKSAKRKKRARNDDDEEWLPNTSK